MDEILFKAIYGIVTVLAAIVTRYVVPYFKAKIGTEKMENIIKWGNLAVQAAEIKFPHGDNENKKDFVINSVYDKFCAKKEIITKDQIEVILEAAVKEFTK